MYCQKKRIDLNKWSFNDHFETILELLEKAGADDTILQPLRSWF